MAATIDVNDLTPEQRKQLGLTKRRGPRSMSAHEVKSYAFRVCNVVADLTPAERGRVLRQALKLNAT